MSDRGEARSLAGSTATIASATLAARLVGLAREQLQAFLFGAGMVTDAFNVALRIPNLTRDLLAEGALLQVFVPKLRARLTTGGPEQASAFTDRVGGGLLIVCGAVAVLGTLLAPWLVGSIAGGVFAVPGKGELAIGMTRILMPFVVVTALSAVATGVLFTQRRFFAGAIAPVFLNLGMILATVAVVWVAPQIGIEPGLGLAFGMLAGGLIQLLYQQRALRNAGYRFRPRFEPADPGVRELVAQVGPAAVSSAATQINTIVNVWMASWLVQGSISWLSYSLRVIQLPIGMFGVATAWVAQVDFADRVAAGDRGDARASLARALRLVLALTIPASVGLAVLAGPIVALLYQYRRFGPADTQATAGALELYAIGLAGYGVTKLLLGVLFTLDERWPQVRAALGAVGANLALSTLLVGSMGHRGLALAASIAALLQMTLLARPVSRRVGGLFDRGLFAHVVRVAIASAGLAAVSSATAGWITARVGSATPAARLLVVAGAITTGAAALVALFVLLGVNELADVWHALRLRMRELLWPRETVP